MKIGMRVTVPQGEDGVMGEGVRVQGEVLP